ncbi:transposase [Streptomyces rubradiris]|uniref:Transposase n=1 Tax=Streptomyces rubradiris TaxID=285531 RepID=A0ABQ3R8J4_STRRR|nr:transposase [Streptomyces rubradiris]GHH23313.1 hypothetical protein GCM10018792_59880 [Streptomyces rubradiris]GHI52168.1 hypothetical protein Srubr_20140 [Streptomyces rubradiris]
MTPPHRKLKKKIPDWYEELHERQRKAHSSRRIRVENGIAHLKNWQTLTRSSAAVSTSATPSRPSVAGLLSHLQTTGLTPARQE